MIELPSRLKDIEPTSDAPFKDDKLNRVQYASILRSIVDTYSSTSCVLSINGEWGTGKTTFVKMWVEYMKRLGYRTIYFNAWETDYIEDPFIAILGELHQVFNTDENFTKICSSIGRIMLGLGKMTTKIALKTAIGLTSDEIDDVINETADIFKDSIKEYSQQKATFLEFKTALKEYVANISENEKLPVIFVIDELDRCNPHYAIKVLERIKHLFDIPNIFFVLPICKSQLENSIQGFYGSDKVDSANYLRRFIDLEFELPAPSGDDFCRYLFDYYNFGVFFEQYASNYRSKDYIELFTNSVQRLFVRTNIDLRTMDKIFAHSRIVAQQSSGDYRSGMDVIFLLCYLKILYFDIYKKIRSHDYTLQALLEAIEDIFPLPLLNEKCCDNFDAHGFTYTVANLLCAYNQNDGYEYEKGIIPKSKEDRMILKCGRFTISKLTEALLHCSTNPRCRWHSLKDLMDKIDLLYQLQ